MSSNNTVLEISNSRKNILSILEKHQGYDVSDYAEFSMHEIDAMITNNQLDMLVQHKENNKIQSNNHNTDRRENIPFYFYCHYYFLDYFLDPVATSTF